MSYVTLSLWASPLLLWASMFPSVRWGQWWKLHLRLLAALFLVPSAPSFEGRGCYCPTLPFSSSSQFLSFPRKAEQSSLSPYLQDVNVCIAEVNVEDFGKRDTRAQHSCGEKKWPGTISMAKRHQPFWSLQYYVFHAFRTLSLPILVLGAHNLTLACLLSSETSPKFCLDVTSVSSPTRQTEQLWVPATLPEQLHYGNHNILTPCLRICHHHQIVSFFGQGLCPQHRGGDRALLNEGTEGNTWDPNKWLPRMV